MDATYLQAGSLALQTDPQPALSGAQLLGIADSFVGRVHISPSAIEFGSIGSDKAIVVKVFNTNSAAVILTDVVLAGLSEVSTSTPLPVTIQSFSEAQIVITAKLNGDPFLDGSAVFQLSTGDIAVPVTGQRINGFYDANDWSGGVQVISQYKTAIFTSRNGTESRQQLRESPRVTRSYLYTLERDDLRKAMTNLRTWQGNPHAVPCWEFKQDATLTAGAVTVQHVTLYQVGGLAYVNLAGAESLVQVLDITGDTLTLDTTDSGTGTVAPAALAYTRSTDVRQITDQLAQSMISWEAMDGPVIGSFAPDMQYSMPIFTLGHNYNKPPQIKVQERAESLDSETGAYYQRQHALPSTILSYNYTLFDINDVNYLLGFWDYCAGAHGEFLLVDELDGVTPTENIVQSIITNDTRLLTLQPAVFGVKIKTSDGQELIKKIDDIYRIGDKVYLLTDDATLNLDYTIVDKIALIYRARFNSDSLRIDFVTDSVAESGVEFKILTK